MTLTITDPETDLLLELLTTKRDAMLHELHHTDTNDFKDLLKRNLDLLEGLKAKIENLRSLRATSANPALSR
jgi:hypothetical protein